MKIREIALILFVPVRLSLSGCSKISTDFQNVIGAKVEAYHSAKTNVVCFTTSSGKQDNIYCLPDSQVNTSKLKNNTWVAV